MRLVRYLLVGSLTLLALGLLATAWLSRHSFARVPAVQEVGFKGEARENRTLLLQKWLEASGRTVSRQGGYLNASALPGNGTLILLQVSPPLSPLATQELLDWVRQGGQR